MRERLLPLTLATFAAAAALIFGVSQLASDELAVVSADEAVDGPETTTPSTSTPSTSTTTTTTTSTTTTTPLSDEALPDGSGSGHRVVFSVSRQRIWWVEGDEVLGTALTSGRPDTPQTGTFQVYSKSANATGLDGSTMRNFVRFTHGPNGWAIGFHDIPLVDGVPAQTADQLGQALSHGCIRQAPEDAQRTWDFLDVGDTVVVVD